MGCRVDDSPNYTRSIHEIIATKYLRVCKMFKMNRSMHGICNEKYWHNSWSKLRWQT